MQPQIITGGFPQIDSRLMTLEMMHKASEILMNVGSCCNLSHEECGQKTWQAFTKNIVKFLQEQSEKL